MLFLRFSQMAGTDNEKIKVKEFEKAVTAVQIKIFNKTIFLPLRL